jgi:hypothetical protein
MAERQDFDAGKFADGLAVMTDEELFALMQTLEDESEDVAPEERGTREVFAKIALVETSIEERFPGQLMTPYKDWQRRRTDI